ncbi:Glutamine--fructose-6-phosphate aminotransferase [isomerizing] [uncultured archaeon]|nr:Glutamine--fructose-6-phosphate aminotransferase [isomerizing] [uncultured archaeon]
MCGIIGYIGHRKASEVILKGLRKLEYRGYDSAGIATLDGSIKVIKDIGRIDDIHRKKNFLQLEGTAGIGHTRWATHGGVTQENAHPHTDCSKKIFVIHNGVIENFDALKRELEGKGHKFSSETDTELVAHLIEEERGKEKAFGKAFAAAVARLSGSWSLVVMAEGEGAIHLSRNGPPLVLGVGKGEMFCASDVPALLEYTKSAVFLEDGDRAEITRDGFAVFGQDDKKIQRKAHTITWTAAMAEKDGYPHFMLKEIHEQQSKVREALSADVSGAVSLLRGEKQVAVVACGTSYYAGLVFKSLIQPRLGIGCEVIYGSEFAYVRTGSERAIVAISQSGETADTLSAVRLAKKSGAKVIAITNVVGSSLYREADEKVAIGAGPELAVVATKSFTCQIAVLAKIALSLSGEQKGIPSLALLSDEIEKLLMRASEIKKMASELAHQRDFFFIGRSLSFPSSLEGALKLKEITYLHAEAYPAGELKHGPLSLLEKGVVVIALAPSDASFAKTVSNIQECRARNATLVVFSDSDEAVSKSAFSFRMPRAEGAAIPILYAIPLQLLAYYMAVELKRDPDKPRNLAKSVTVE